MEPEQDQRDSQPEALVTVEEEPHISSNVCDVCMNDNLLQKVGILYCTKCHSPFCLHFCSKIDPVYCVDCFSDMTLEREKITKTYEIYNEVTDTLRTYSRRARRIQLSGESWLFAQMQIKDRTDAELDMQIEYHRQLCQLIILETEERKIKKMHRNAGVKVKFPSTQSTTVTTTTVKKSTKTSSTANQAKLSALLTSMLANGMTPEGLQALLKKSK